MCGKSVHLFDASFSHILATAALEAVPISAVYSTGSQTLYIGLSSCIVGALRVCVDESNLNDLASFPTLVSLSSSAQTGLEVCYCSLIVC
jgi:hypothetical protein